MLKAKKSSETLDYIINHKRVINRSSFFNEFNFRSKLEWHSFFCKMVEYKKFHIFNLTGR